MKIAIIGSGISGLGTAYLLNTRHDITVYEKNGYIGGHSRTLEVDTPDGAIPVDTGFIVFNYRNYPLLTGLFNHLNVPVAKSDMSFGVSINNGWFEYGTLQLKNMIAQKRNLLRPQFWRMVKDVLRFNKAAFDYMDKDESITMRQCLDELGMGKWFRDYFILAMGGAIWSTPLEKMLDFPAKTFIRFFDNHGLLAVEGQPQWYTVEGGSREYVSRLISGFRDKIRLNSGVISVTRKLHGIEVKDVTGTVELYDQVVFASHSDQTLSMMTNPTNEEKRVLGDVSYQPNEVILHSDTSFMPKRKAAWSSWVYLSEDKEDNNPAVSLSYWMNNLQPLKTSHPIIVTLNPGREPNPDLIHDRHTFEHPVFTTEAIRAQNDLNEIQGRDRIWFCGAWSRYGFHEDGLLSAVTVAKKMGINTPWK